MGKTRQVITGAAAILLLGYVHPVRAAEPSGGPSNAVSPDSPGAAESARDPRPLGITTAMTEPTDASRPSVGLPEDLGSDRLARASKKKSKKSSVSKVKKKKREKKAAKKVTKKKQKTKKKRVSPH